MEEIQENKRIIMEKLSQHKIDILGINAIVGQPLLYMNYSQHQM